MMDDFELEEVTIEEQRNECRELTAAAEAWMYEQDDETGHEAFEGKLAEILALYAPMELRMKELEARPKLLEDSTKVRFDAQHSLH
jgi:hypothetical protein